MRPSQIEHWALHVIDTLSKGRKAEDTRVELKAALLSEEKMARQIAAHANAARGEPILWLIGVDEIKGIVEVENFEVSDWYARVEKNFDGLAPRMLNLNIPVDNNKYVVALFFETDRAPFVVKNPMFGTTNGGPIQMEVPWREGNSTRTARRADLIRMLVPAQLTPTIEVRSGYLRVHRASSKKNMVESSGFSWDFQLAMYLIPRSSIRLVIPFHHCECVIKPLETGSEIVFDEITLSPQTKTSLQSLQASGIRTKVDSCTIQSTSTELLVDGPGLINLKCVTQTDNEHYFSRDADVSLSLRGVDFDRAISIAARLRYKTPDKNNKGVLDSWELVELDPT